MIKHIVFWQLKTFASAEDKARKLKEIKDALEALPLKISEIKSLEVNLNINPSEAYDIMLSASFNNMDDLSVYAKHPDHVKAGGVIKPAVEKRACVDYEY